MAIFDLSKAVGAMSKPVYRLSKAIYMLSKPDGVVSKLWVPIPRAIVRRAMRSFSLSVTVFRQSKRAVLGVTSLLCVRAGMV